MAKKSSKRRLTEAVKYDVEKVRLDLVSILAEEEIAKVLTFGAKKYAAHNWRLGMHWSRLLRASRGHLGAFMRGEDLDPETGLTHLAHAGCCIMFLLEYWLTGNGIDDRWDEFHKMPVAKRRLQNDRGKKFRKSLPSSGRRAKVQTRSRKKKKG